MPKRPSRIDLLEPAGHIQFDHVSFRYPAAAEVSVQSLEEPGLVAELATMADEIKQGLLLLRRHL